MIKIKVTDEMMRSVLRTARNGEDLSTIVLVILALVERDLNASVFGTHVDGDYWQVSLEAKGEFSEHSPGCIEVTA